MKNQVLISSLLAFLLLLPLDASALDQEAAADALEAAPTDDFTLTIHAASLERTADYDAQVIATPHGDRAVWVGEVLLSIEPEQVEEFRLESHQGSRVVVLVVDASAAREYRSVLQEQVGEHIAFALDEHVLFAPEVQQAMAGRRVMLFGVPEELIEPYRARVERAQERG